MRQTRTRQILVCACGLLAGTILVSGVACFLFPPDALALVPAPALRLIPIDVRPLRYLETFRGCGEGWVQGYEATDGARITATNMSEPGQVDWLRELGDGSSILFRHPFTDPYTQATGERVLARVVDPQLGEVRFVLCVIGTGNPLRIEGPTERHVLDVERIELGDRALVRTSPWAAPN